MNNAQSDMPGGRRTAGAPAVRCEDLVVRYGKRVAVDHLTFDAQAGEVTALLGPNGAGKTSTIETLEGYRSPTSGDVRVLGQDPVANKASLVPFLGVMLQRGGLYPSLRPVQLLRLFASYYPDPLSSGPLLDLVGLTAVARSPIRHLSGGEQQRLALAAALVGRPRVVFLDEPTAGVDPEGRQTVRRVIADLRAEGVCVLVTTHELGEAERLADNVVIIRHGQKIADDSPANLAASAADGVIRFSAPPGIDTALLATAIGRGAEVSVSGTGTYEAHVGDMPVPGATAIITTWLADHGVPLTNLRTTRSLEEIYLEMTGALDDTLCNLPGNAAWKGAGEVRAAGATTPRRRGDVLLRGRRR